MSVAGASPLLGVCGRRVVFFSEKTKINKIPTRYRSVNLLSEQLVRSEKVSHGSHVVSNSSIINGPTSPTVQRHQLSLLAGTRPRADKSPPVAYEYPTLKPTGTFEFETASNYRFVSYSNTTRTAFKSNRPTQRYCSPAERFFPSFLVFLFTPASHFQLFPLDTETRGNFPLKRP